MKKNVRLVLLFALIAVMVVMTAVFASAATVADADSFMEAINNGDATIELEDDITLDEGVIIDHDVTIIGNSYTITFTAGSLLDAPINNSSGTSHREVRNYAFNFAGGTVVLENVTVVAPATGEPGEDEELTADAMVGIFTFTGEADVTLDAVVTDGGYYAVMFGANAKLTVEAGSNLGANSGKHYVMGGSVDCTPTIVINGGHFETGVSGDLTRFDAGANLTINGGEIVGKSDAIYFNGGNGSVVITDGSITTGGSCMNILGTGTITVTGGTFTGGTGIKIQTTGAVSIKNATITASGGTVVAVYKTASLVIENCTLWGNGSGACVYLYDAACKSITIKNSNLYGYRGIRFNVDNSGVTCTIENCTYRLQYTKNADGDITDYCTAGYLISYSSEKKFSNSTFNIIGCDLNNTVYGTGEALSSFGKTAGGYVFVDNGECNNTWLFKDCDIVWSNTTYTFQAYKSNKVTLENCVVNATSTLSASNSTGGMFQTNNAGTFNIIGGTYTYNGKRPMMRVADGGITVNIEGATFINNGPSNMFRQDNGKLNIKDCTLTQNGEATMVHLTDEKSGAFTATDSTFASGSNLAFDIQGKHPVNMNGVTVAGTIQIAEGYPASVALTDVECTELIDPSNAAVIATTKVKYFELGGVAMTWDEVMAALKAGDVVTIVGAVDWPLAIDTEIAFTIDFNGYTVPAPVFSAGCNVTFLNYTVTVSTGYALTVPADVTLTLGAGCAITSTGDGYAIANNGNLTINDGTYGGTVYNNKTLVINDGIFTQTSTFSHHKVGSPVVFMNDAVATTTINGGIFSKTNAADQDDGDKDAVIASNDADSAWIINDGVFTAEGDFGYVANFHSIDSVAILGGTFISENSDAPVIRIGSAQGAPDHEVASSDIKDFTTIGGSVGVLFQIHYQWEYVVGDVTVLDAALGMFEIVVTGEHAYASSAVVFTGRYTFDCYASDAFMLKVEGLGTTTIDGAIFINNCEASEAAIVIVGDAVVNFTNAIVLGNAGAAYKTDSETVAFGAAKVKLSGETYSLWMATAGEADASLKDGASVRAEIDSTGIRFSGTATKVEGATYGIIIAPADYVAAAGAFTKEALDAFATARGLAANQVYQMVTATNSLHDNGETVSFSVALVNIKATNANRAFAAVAFVTVDGETTYGDYTSAANTATMAAIAKAALEDTKTAAELEADPTLVNKYAHEVEAGVYSKYTADERAALAAYVA